MSYHPPPPKRFRPEPLPGVLRVVIVLLGVGAYALVRSIPKVRVNPLLSEVDAAAAPVMAVISDFYSRHGAVPRDLSELLSACRDAGLSGDALPVDPWGRPLLYEPHDHEKGGTYLTSLGADGRPGGSAENRDVSIWMGDL